MVADYGNFLTVDNRYINTPICHVKKTVIIKPSAVMEFSFHTETERLTSYILTETLGYFVIPVKHGTGESILMKKNILLCLNIFVHILMNIKMIGFNICYNRNIGTLSH